MVLYCTYDYGETVILVLRVELYCSTVELGILILNYELFVYTSTVQ